MRTRKTGSIRKRKDGRYEGRIFLGRHPNGTPKTFSVFAATQTECESALKAAIDQVAITGKPLLVASNVTGTGGAFSWIGLSQSIGELEHDRNALFADPAYVAFLDENAELFEPGFSVSILRSLA